MPPPKGEPYYVDWVWVNTTNVHIANHRDWFSTFTPYEGTLQTGFGTSIAFHGFGTVHLPVDLSNPTKKAPPLTLHRVLYAPDSIINIYASPCEPYHIIKHIGTDSTLVTPKERTVVAILDNPHVYKIRLVGHKVNQSIITRDHLLVNCRMSLQEMQRFQRFLDGRCHPNDDTDDMSPPPLGPVTNSGEEPSSSTQNLVRLQDHYEAGEVPPYSEAEFEWIKREHGSEYQFLKSLGLYMCKDKDRVDGRVLARAIMSGKKISPLGRDEIYGLGTN